VLYGEGNELRNFIHLADIAGALNILMANSPSLNSEIYNLGSLKSTTVSNLCGIALSIARETIGLDRIFRDDFFTFNCKSRLGDPKNMIGDFGKLRSLGFTPSVEPENGLKKYFQWILQQS
jgi:nucleoside-diphosphate-sugar epimerase